MVLESGQIPLLREWVKEALEQRFPEPSPQVLQTYKARKHQGNPWLETWEDGFFIARYTPTFPPCPTDRASDPTLTFEQLALHSEMIRSWLRACDNVELEYGFWLQTQQEVRRRWITDARRGCPKWQRGYCGAKCRDGSPCQAPVTPHGTRCQRHGGARQEAAFLKRLEFYEDLFKRSSHEYARFAPLTPRLMRFLDDGKPSGMLPGGFKRHARGSEPFALRRTRRAYREAYEAKRKRGEVGPTQREGEWGDWCRQRYAELVKDGCPILAEFLYGREGRAVSRGPHE